MKSLVREDVPVVIEGNGVEVRLQEIGGGMSTSFIRLPQGADLGPALVGLPGDSCQCPHWGYLLSGRLQMRTPDGDRVYEAGQAVYWAPGHVPVALENTEYVDFSPTEDFQVVIDHLRG
ncbi:MAG TPA: hypothetical protein VFR07_18915 [Mycobacteriales bacterium]|jgi:hypothetical protein|nr:hypothetical protein [Mycobacteriales bacterium]